MLGTVTMELTICAFGSAVLVSGAQFGVGVDILLLFFDTTMPDSGTSFPAGPSQTCSFVEYVTTLLSGQEYKFV